MTNYVCMYVYILKYAEPKRRSTQKKKEEDEKAHFNLKKL